MPPLWSKVLLGNPGGKPAQVLGDLAPVPDHGNIQRVTERRWRAFWTRTLAGEGNRRRPCILSPNDSEPLRTCTTACAVPTTISAVRLRPYSMTWSGRGGAITRLRDDAVYLTRSWER
jgi:hypothetical protein